MFQKKLDSKKKLKFERFEKFQYFSWILRQICYNLVKKIHVQKRERTSFNVRERNWLTSGKKRTHLIGWFCSHIYKYGAK